MFYRFLLVILLFAASCNNEEENSKSNPVKIIFDTDMGSDCDDAGALALLHQYANEDKAKILACVYSSGRVPYGAGVIQAINNYYKRPEIPVGAYQGSDIGDPIDKMNAEFFSKNQDTYGNSIVHNRDAEDMVSLVRRILANQYDESVTYITVGHTKGLHDVLVSKPDEISPLSGEELIRKKVKRWIAMGASNAHKYYNNYNVDYNLMFNGTAVYSDYLIENFPVEACFVNAGTDVLTGKSLLNTPEGNIVRATYSEWLKRYNNTGLMDQRPSWDLAAVYYAVEDTSRFLDYAPKGYMDFEPDKGCKWIRMENHEHKNQKLVFQKKGMEQKFSDYLNYMISLPPKN